MKAPILHQDQLTWTPVPCSVTGGVAGALYGSRGLQQFIIAGLGPKAAIPSQVSGDGVNYESRTWAASQYQQNFSLELLPYFMYILWYIIYYMWILINACGATETC